MKKQALIVGVSGVIGRALAEQLQKEGWDVTGLSRGRGAVPDGCRSLTADLTDSDAVRDALAQEKPDALFFSTSSSAALSTTGPRQALIRMVSGRSAISSAASARCQLL